MCLAASHVSSPANNTEPKPSRRWPTTRYLPFVLLSGQTPCWFTFLVMMEWWQDEWWMPCTCQIIYNSFDFPLEHFCIVVFSIKDWLCFLHCYKLAAVRIQIKCNDSCLAPLRWDASSQSRLWITSTFSWKHTPDSCSLLSKLPHLFQSIQTAAICNSTALIPRPGNLQLMQWNQFVEWVRTVQSYSACHPRLYSSGVMNGMEEMESRAAKMNRRTRWNYLCRQ